ncbi:IS66 family insertion sequence element accessory protein TnpA [Acetivibrio saccincola]|uniref:Transposase n=1 Tax=Acetivibrio saccincola TaxID=1677857 RepID=A0A2K9EFB8_9FIRM|nr:hypothetical protein [Acetivibrio saccincola]AUG56593.1 hypothetical protein HVS_03225 [Acetivibrio saccincola]
MNQIETNEYWKDILEKFSKYEGTISGFCREYDVNIHRLYYQRKKLRKKNESIFHAINLNGRKNKIENSPDVKNNLNPSNEIRIEIGKAKKYISNSDELSLSNALKEIVRSC